MVKNINEGQFESLFRDGRKADRISPPENVWDRLEDKLDSHKNHKSKTIYKIWGFAATFLVLITAGIMINGYMDQKPNSTVAINGSNSPIAMEELGTAKIHYANFDNMVILDNAYAKLFTTESN